MWLNERAWIYRRGKASMTRTQGRSTIIIIMGLLLIMAAGVRIINLDAQALWYDEGVAYGHSQRSLLELIPRLQDNVHVPAYFGSLALWEDVTGSSEFALRYYSVLWSVLGIAFAFALGKRLYGDVAGLAAAAFIAFNTFNIYYAQETRMYAMLAAVAAWSMLQFVLLVQRASSQTQDTSPQANRQLAYTMLGLALINTLGMYTHISYALVMVAQGVLALLWLLYLIVGGKRGTQTRFSSFARGFAVYFISSLLTVALFTPWLPTAITQIFSQPNISGTVPTDDILRTFQGWLGFGRTFEQSMGGMAAVMYFLMAFGLVIWPGSRPLSWWRLLVPLVWVLLSVGLYWQLELYERYLRFLLPAQMGAALWLGRGVWVIWTLQPRRASQGIVRRAPQAIALIVIVAYSIGLLRGLAPLYNDPAHQRDDYRAIIATIEAQSAPDDAVILSAQGLQEIFGYYYAGDLPVLPLPLDDDVRDDIGAVLDSAETIFTLLYGELEQDPTRSVERTLATQAYPLDSRWFGDPRLLRYAAPAPLTIFDAVQAQFGEHITLQSIALDAGDLTGGDYLRAELRWTTDAALAQSYAVFLQLLSADGRVLAQRDSTPVNGLLPTSAWQPQTQVIDRHALLLPDDLPAGTYTLITGLYDPNNPTERLPVGAGNFLTLAVITVA